MVSGKGVGIIKKTYALLERIEHDYLITQETDREFLYLLQHGLLLALKEKGTLNAMQYRRAEENLKRLAQNQL